MDTGCFGGVSLFGNVAVEVFTVTGMGVNFDLLFRDVDNPVFRNAGFGIKRDLYLAVKIK